MVRALSAVLSLAALATLAERPQAAERPPYAASGPLGEPRVFAAGTLCTGDYESHPAFSPDGRTFYFLKNAPDFSFWTIVESRWTKERWSDPEVAAFSGRYSDADPFVTADGSRLYFISNRPLPGDTSASARDLDIWVVRRSGSGWGSPERLPEPVNSAGNEWHPTLAGDGTIYFGSDRPGGKGRTDLYRCSARGAEWGPAENLGDSVNTAANEFEPWIAPDQSYLLFMGGGRPQSRGGFDLWIARPKDGVWSEVENLGDLVNSPANELSPKISPDGRYFFWTSTRGFGAEPRRPRRADYRELRRLLDSPGNGLGDIYQIDVERLGIRR